MINRLAKPKARALPRQLRMFADAKEVMAQRNPSFFERQLTLSTAEVVVTPEELALPAVRKLMKDTIDVAGRSRDGRFVAMLAPGLRLSFFKRVLKLCGPERFLPDFLARGNRLN